MKKVICIIIGIIISVSLIICGIHIKNNNSPEYYLSSQESYIETISKIYQIQDKKSIHIYKDTNTLGYISFLYSYNNEIHFHIFKQKIGSYYTSLFHKNIKMTDQNIYYKTINQDDKNVIFLFGYNPYNDTLSFDVAGTYKYTYYSQFYHNEYNIGMVVTTSSIGDNIKIYNEDYSTNLGFAIRCE